MNLLQTHLDGIRKTFPELVHEHIESGLDGPRGWDHGSPIFALGLPNAVTGTIGAGFVDPGSCEIPPKGRRADRGGQMQGACI